MITPPEIMNRVAALAYRATALTLVAALAACADDAAPSRMVEPTPPSFAKNVTGANQRILFISLRDGNQELYSMNPDGTGQTRLTNNAAGDAYGVWSPDGKRIAFASTRDNAYGDIYTMNPDGSGIVRLTNSVGSSTQPTWSKDGKQIAFMSNRAAANPAAQNPNDWEIYVMNADGTNVTRVTNNAFMDATPLWSPDGKQLAFISNRDDPALNELYVMNVDGSLVTRLTSLNESIGDAGWDPHARRLAFSALTGIYVVDADTHVVTRLTFGPVGQDLLPSFSADGTKIAFTSARNGATYDIYSMNADGSGQTRLTDNFAIDFFPRWAR